MRVYDDDDALQARHSEREAAAREAVEQLAQQRRLAREWERRQKAGGGAGGDVRTPSADRLVLGAGHRPGEIAKLLK